MWNRPAIEPELGTAPEMSDQLSLSEPDIEVVVATSEFAFTEAVGECETFRVERRRGW